GGGGGFYQQQRFFPAAVEITGGGRDGSGVRQPGVDGAVAGVGLSFPDVVRLLTGAADSELQELAGWLTTEASGWESAYEQLVTERSLPLPVTWNGFMRAVA
ncbi:hypothetical protein, partial [Actinoplanes sp. NBRC 103695]|uniref:hypothetical protein n=1 Tax=Actinoplanes sp. NBRC 103695 TaxID=3032202 RepID=UPI002553141F